MKKIFITGTESFVGKELIKQIPKSFEISGCDYNQPINKDFYKLDIRSKSICDIIPNGVDTIVHLAALSTDPLCKNRAYHCFDINVMGTLNLIRAAEQKKCKQFIFASSEWVYDNFTNDKEKNEDSIINIANINSEYALSKLVSEANLRQKYLHGFCDTSILRFGIIYGTRKENWSAVESIFNTVKNKNVVKVGSVKTGRCFIHVSDIVNGIIQTIGLKGFNLINLEGKKLITLGEIIKKSSNILNKNIEVIEEKPDDISVRRVSSVKSKSVIGWDPVVGLTQGLEDLNKIL